MQLLIHYESGAVFGKAPHLLGKSIAIVVNVARIGLLYNSYFQNIAHIGNIVSGTCIVTQCSEPCCFINTLQSIFTT